MSRLVLSVLLAVLTVPVPTAQTVVSLDEALLTARSRTIEVLRADAQVQQARVGVQAVRDRRLPSLSLAAGGGQRYGLSFDQTSGDLTQATVQSLDLGLDARYVLFDGRERRAQARSAEAGLRAAELDRARAEQQAGVAVLQGYLDLALARAARTVAVEDAEAQRQLLSEIEVQVDVGERAAYEVAQQQERVATARAAILAAERSRALAEARLTRILGLDAAGDYTFPTPEAPDAEPVAPAAALVRQALDGRPDLRAAAAAIEAAEADRRAARAGGLPQVEIGGFVGTSYSSAGEVTFPSQVGDNRSGSLRLSVSVPLFDRGATRERVRLAEARAAALRAEEVDARRGVALEVRERRIEVDALAAQAAVAEVRVRAAEQALDAERARFDAGEATLQAVSLLQARVVEARTERARLAVEARFQRLLLAVAVGS